MIHLGVILFSPKFQGTKETWDWVCDASNGRNMDAPQLSEAQYKYAYDAGYLSGNDIVKQETN